MNSVGDKPSLRFSHSGSHPAFGAVFVMVSFSSIVADMKKDDVVDRTLENCGGTNAVAVDAAPITALTANNENLMTIDVADNN